MERSPKLILQQNSSNFYVGCWATQHFIYEVQCCFIPVCSLVGTVSERCCTSRVLWFLRFHATWFKRCYSAHCRSLNEIVTARIQICKFHPVWNGTDPHRKLTHALFYPSHVFFFAVVFFFFSGQKRESHKAVSEGGTNLADSELTK